MVLYISISYQVIDIVCLDQLKGAPHSHTSDHDKKSKCTYEKGNK